MADESVMDAINPGWRQDLRKLTKPQRQKLDRLHKPNWQPRTRRPRKSSRHSVRLPERPWPKCSAYPGSGFTDRKPNKPPHVRSVNY